jgi:hypothetical protein
MLLGKWFQKLAITYVQKKKASYYFGKTIESIPICFSLLKLTKQEDAVVQCEAYLNKLYRLT